MTAALLVLVLTLGAAVPALAQAPSAGQQRQEAEAADALAFSEAGQYLRGARLALQGGHAAQATELLERAESLLLNRAGTPTRPVRSGPVAQIAKARAAVAAGQLAEARAATERALGLLEARRRPRQGR